MITFTDLAKKYNFASATSISEFNKGLTYVRDINYPIRKEILIGNGKLTSQDVEEIIKILQNTYRSYESIGKQYGVEARAISRINRGIFHYNKKLEYPIREGRLCSIPPKFSYEQVTDIISYLLNTNLSFSEIAKIFNAKYRDILDINNGETKLYRRKELNYPLRTKN